MGLSNAGSSAIHLDHRQDRRQLLLGGQQVAEFLLDDVADHRLGLGTEYVERVRRDVVVGRRLQCQQPDLRAVAVGDDDLVAGCDRGDAFGCRPDVGPLVLRGHGLPAPQQRVAAERDHDPHDVPQPSAATRTALIVCIRFSACSKAMFAGLSKTSSVTSIPFARYGYCAAICAPTFVSQLWNAGRQCMNFTRGLPAARHQFGVDLEREQHVDTVAPRLDRLTHRHPHVGVDEVDAAHRLERIIGDGDPGPGRGREVLAHRHMLVAGKQIVRRADSHVHAELGAHQKQ